MLMYYIHILKVGAENEELLAVVDVTLSHQIFKTLQT